MSWFFCKSIDLYYLDHQMDLEMNFWRTSQLMWDIWEDIYANVNISREMELGLLFVERRTFDIYILQFNIFPNLNIPCNKSQSLSVFLTTREKKKGYTRALCNNVWRGAASMWKTELLKVWSIAAPSPLVSGLKFPLGKGLSRLKNPRRIWNVKKRTRLQTGNEISWCLMKGPPLSLFLFFACLHPHVVRVRNK